jgi:hypothetical protein
MHDTMPFTYATIDDDGEVIRKFRWSVKEAKWFTTNNPCVKVIKLIVEKPRPFNYDEFTKLYGEPLY